MLTKIEIDGFKSFEDFSLELSPLLVILGPNGSGKSNFFDALKLLSRLAKGDIRSALSELRGDPHEVFRQSGPTRAETITLAVEVLLDPLVSDPWQERVRVSYHRLRYELQLSRRTDDRGLSRVYVSREEVTPILAKHDVWVNRYCSESFRKARVHYGRRSPFLETEYFEDGLEPVFRIAQDGVQGRKRSAHAAEATILSSVTSSEFPHLYALKQELTSARFLQLDPVGLRKPASMLAPELLAEDGSNLAAVLARIQASTGDDQSTTGSIADIASDLAAIVPGVMDLKVESDEARKEYRLIFKMRDEAPFPAQLVSDGTLRIVALLTMLHDPEQRGLICFEEPENGIHPGRLRDLIDVLSQMTTEVGQDWWNEEETEPARQLLMNSHSPVVLAELSEESIVFCDTVRVPNVDNGVSRSTRMRRVLKARLRRISDDSDDLTASWFEIHEYLSTASKSS